MKHSWPLALVAAAIVMTPAAAQGPPSANYWVYVGAESADLIHLVRFGPGGAEVEKTFIVGEMQVETEGPHGLRTSRDGRYLYMTTGHGIPDGKLWKIETGVDTVVGDPILLGRFPATIDLTPDDLYAFAIVVSGFPGPWRSRMLSVLHRNPGQSILQRVRRHRWCSSSWR